MYKLNKMGFYEILKKENYSVKRIAQKSKVSMNTVYKLYSYIHPTLNYKTAQQLANTYGMDVYDLLGEEL